mmetsp:Transcript_1499/g.4387  ORF Transcript_1499/g.4387 Transcript_1499/m.4387 type:complete len:385 (-) Transcript_1499:273-1427(-)
METQTGSRGSRSWTKALLPRDARATPFTSDVLTPLPIPMAKTRQPLCRTRPMTCCWFDTWPSVRRMTARCAPGCGGLRSANSRGRRSSVPPRSAEAPSTKALAPCRAACPYGTLPPAWSGRNVLPKSTTLKKQSTGSDWRKMPAARFACSMRGPRMEPLQSRTNTASSRCAGASNLGTRCSISASVPRPGRTSRTTTGSKRALGRTTNTASVRRPLAAISARALPAQLPRETSGLCVGDSMAATPPAMLTEIAAVNAAAGAGEPYARASLWQSASPGVRPCCGEYRGDTCEGIVSRTAPSASGSSRQYSRLTSTCSPGRRPPMEVRKTSVPPCSSMAERRPRLAASSNTARASAFSRSSPTASPPCEKRARKPDTEAPSASGNT